ncbi:BACON domain-containing protein [Streptomyces zingiberis]|uniref:Sigma-70 family RNA polymerase sigma factor n=1 Tax=Streptomyces zingiberis TaxID=2053010 RepID=A0ABX1C4Q2_9ACTN|nr:sigma-70 family RNA polymerase sigma factor [Streptomyces zingiberis]NJQ03648.1 sigma-70 family RNA polymerase sigma factor [Streptomyces zingiberis]
MSSTREPPTAPGTRYEPYLDGLFTYCLAATCEHDAATAVLGEVLAHAERRGPRLLSGRGRARARLYALARWTCLRHLAERDTEPSPGDPAGPPIAEETAGRRRRELHALVWPEAAGTTREQREALELAVRHRLTPPEVAAVLGVAEERARRLLTAGAREVERTRAALALVERGGCPAVSRLAGDPRALMAGDLRRELLRHLQDCGPCRRTAERVPAAGPGPGATVAGTLPLLPAPRAAAHAAMLAALRAAPRGAARPHYDRDGFPLDPGRPAARRRVLRRRAATAAVVAAAVAAPVFALWAAYRSAPPGEDRYAGPVSATDGGGRGGQGDGAGGPGHGAGADGTGRRGEGAPQGSGDSGGPGEPGGSGEAGKGHSRADGPSDGARDGGRAGRGDGRLTVTSRRDGAVTVITLSLSGSAPARWSARTEAAWLRLSARSGTLRPGRPVTLTVTTDRGRQPRGAWTARVVFQPYSTAVTVTGHGGSATPGGDGPGPGPVDPPPAPEPSPPAQEPTEPPAETSPEGDGAAD